MAGVVAMAAVIEDFDATQPCKKARKDDDPPPTRTITNYFMPLSKVVEKPFSPPRSSNIMDYFRKASPSQEKMGASQQSSQQQSLESVICQDISAKLSRPRKRTRKSKDQGKLQEETQELLSDNCGMIKGPSESLVKEGGSLSVLGSDTAALLPQISSDICLDEESLKRKSTTEASASDIKLKDMSQNHSNKTGIRGCEDLSNENTLSEKEKGKNAKSVFCKSKKTRVSQGDLCIETEQSFQDASLEVNVDEMSALNSSTITVSFEDFLQSQSQEESEDTMDHDSDICAVETLSDAKSVIIAAPQLSPKTLTVQAEVHPVSPSHESTKAPEIRLASIFSRKKKESQVKDNKTSISSPQVRANILPDLKRKSNVVLLEEDLELAVVESSSTPKCTQEERKQFMNAFKQPSLEITKGKTSKGPGKLKPVQEKATETLERETDEGADKKPSESQPDDTCLEQSIEKKNACSVEKKECGRSVKKRPTDTSEEVPASTLKKAELPIAVEMENASVSVDNSEMQPVKELRRSTRESTRRQTATGPERKSPPRKTRSQEKAAKSTASQDNPAQTSTPKTQKTKKGVYRSEILSPPGKKGSPIRMKFTRVFRSSASKAGDFEISSPVSVRESNSLKKQKQAKKLVQKAKALQQSKQTSAAVKPAVRRSSRRKESVKLNYCEDEDSVIFVEDVSSPAIPSQESVRSQKKLRSMNDVLGKNIPSSKASKNAPASKLAPMFLERKTQRPTAVISIFDDSSRDGSENSQDDEQFRAKREFLKSGLPESLKKQIAKTVANREAYTQACASFQPVVHVQQTPMNWTLSWPESSFLSSLKEFYQLPLMSRVSSTDFLGHTIVPRQRTCREKVSGWRECFTESVRQRLLEEVIASNPSFPVQMYFTRLLKRQKEHLLQTAASESECGLKAPMTAGPTGSVGGKRKRVDLGERTGKLAKKQRSSHTETEIIVISESLSSETGASPEAADSVAISRGQRRRSLRNKQANAEHKPSILSTPENIQGDSVIILDSPSSETMCTEDGMREDVLWTEKYQPQHSNDVIGNTASVGKLHSWLKEWKLRADREERKKLQEKKQEQDSNDSWLGDHTEGLEEEDDQLCNTLLITGPTGVGKTAAVYACAQELGFKVFEVNCSSQRSGRQILSQLKEATQSHQVDIHGVNAHKPTYFNSYSSTAKPGFSPRKVNSPRRVTSSPRKLPQSPRGAMRKGGLAPTSLANFFKLGSTPTSKVVGNQDKKAQTVCSKKSARVTQSECKSQEPTPLTVTDNKPLPEEQGKRTATSLILFEEVDVIFDDDSGFLAAIKTFMNTTKRPVILTTSDPAFSAMFDGSFDEINFTASSVVNLASYLQLVCLVENVWTDTQDLASLLQWNRCDVRQSLLHLQFWARSEGGQKTSVGTAQSEVRKEAVYIKNGSVSEPFDPALPCNSRCTESFLGLLNIQKEKRIEDLLRCEPLAIERTTCWDLLSETGRRGMNLLYSNMEVLLPLPVHAVPESTTRTCSVTNHELQVGLLAKNSSIAQKAVHSDDISPIKVSSRMREKKQLCLDEDVFQSDSESEDGFLSLPKPSCDSAANPDTTQKQDLAAQNMTAPKVTSMRMRRIELSEEERRRSKPVSQCLSSLAEYMDHLSFLDSSLLCQSPQAEGACKQQAFEWTGAEVKSGMTDEVRLECGGQMTGLIFQEISAVIASLSFGKCRAGVSGAWEKAQELDEEARKEAVKELTLPLASHRQSFSLVCHTPCNPRLMEMRKEVISTVLSSRSFSTLGNKMATAVDYLPSLRTICRSERLKEQGKVKRRFMHYFSSIHLDLPKSTIQILASEFP